MSGPNTLPPQTQNPTCRTDIVRASHLLVRSAPQILMRGCHADDWDRGNLCQNRLLKARGQKKAGKRQDVELIFFILRCIIHMFSPHTHMAAGPAKVPLIKRYSIQSRNAPVHRLCSIQGGGGAPGRRKPSLGDSKPPNIMPKLRFS
jgi:hypothetical protein